MEDMYGNTEVGSQNNEAGASKREKNVLIEQK